ncbi:hypothetical protein ACFL3V_05975 [Nanoarchaeota archaeon]
MIAVYARPKANVVEGKLEFLRSKKTVWVDCYNPTKAELEEISKLTGVEVTEFKDHALDERPTTIEADKYSLIVFGAPVLRKHGDNLCRYVPLQEQHGHHDTHRRVRDL